MIYSNITKSKKKMYIYILTFNFEGKNKMYRTTVGVIREIKMNKKKKC